MKKSILLFMLFAMVGCASMTTKAGEDSPPVDVATNPTSLGDSPQRLAELALLTADVWVAYNHDQANQTPDIVSEDFEVDYEVDGYLVGNCQDDTRYGKCEHDGKHAMYGILTHLKKDPSAIFIVFRGTADAADMKLDLKSALATDDFSDPQSGKVGKGFHAAYSGLRLVSKGKKWVDGTVSATEELAKKLSGKTVTITGHSLGAVLATYLSYDLVKKGVKVDGRFFASPKFGDATFVGIYEQTMKDSMATYHVYSYKKNRNDRDVVPTLPPNLKSFTHNYSNIYSSLVDIKNNLLCPHHAEDYAAVLDPKKCSASDKTVCGKDFWAQRLTKNGILSECLIFK